MKKNKHNIKKFKKGNLFFDSSIVSGTNNSFSFLFNFQMVTPDFFKIPKLIDLCVKN